jgi:hypothetical protein
VYLRANFQHAAIIYLKTVCHGRTSFKKCGPKTARMLNAVQRSLTDCIFMCAFSVPDRSHVLTIILHLLRQTQCFFAAAEQRQPSNSKMPFKTDFNLFEGHFSRFLHNNKTMKIIWRPRRDSNARPTA